MKDIWGKSLRRFGPMNPGKKKRVKIERYYRDELQERDYIDVDSFRHLNGPGVTSQVCYELQKTGKAETRMPSGYSWKFEVTRE